MPFDPVCPCPELEQLSGAAPLRPLGRDWWMDAPGLDVLAAACQMLAAHARLITLSAQTGEGVETVVIYHYALGSAVLHLKVSTAGGVLPSITPVLPAASWIEREIMDLFAVTFIGHPEPGRLVRPAQLEPGFFRRPGGSAGARG